jgi:hypothetical protein
MMNDRFSAELRQHLLATADERQADGQLATIVDRVAVTAQRHGLVARLRWFPGRIGPILPAAVRYGLVALALIIATVAAAMLAAGNAPRRTVFEGTWTSIDPGDGSTQNLIVGAGTTPTVHFEDQFATGLACRAEAVKVFTAEGTGTITGIRLDVTFPESGGCGLVKVEVGPGSYTYDQATGSIVDDQQLTWTRVQRTVAPPTRAPVTEPTPGPTGFPVDPDCVDLTNGGVYAERLGSLFVSMSIPSEPLTPWQGHRDQFDLSGSCLFGRPIEIRASIVTTVYADACDLGSGVAVTSQAEVVQQFAVQRGHTTHQLTGVAATIGGFPATWFEVPFEGASCEGLQLWNGIDIGDGSALVYLVDVDGVTLGIALWFRDNPTPTLPQRDEAETIVYSLHIDTGLGPEATDPIPLPECIQFDHTGTYTANVGSLPVSVTVPGTPVQPWSGGRDAFALRKATCEGPGLPLLHAAVVDHVYADSCHWQGSAVETPTASDVVAALQVQQGHDTVGPIETTLGPYAATRFDFSVSRDFDVGTCDRDGSPYVKVWGDEIIVGGGTKQVYVADVGGVTLVVTVGYYPEEITTTGLAEIDAMLATLRVGS